MVRTTQTCNSPRNQALSEDTCIHQSLQGQFKPNLEATPPPRQVASSEGR